MYKVVYTSTRKQNNPFARRGNVLTGGLLWRVNLLTHESLHTQPREWRSVGTGMRDLRGADETGSSDDVARFWLPVGMLSGAWACSMGMPRVWIGSKLQIAAIANCRNTRLEHNGYLFCSHGQSWV